MNFGKTGPRKMIFFFYENPCGCVYKGPVTIVLPNLKMITGQDIPFKVTRNVRYLYIIFKTILHTKSSYHSIFFEKKIRLYYLGF
jgi:hypothetical protein